VHTADWYCDGSNLAGYTISPPNRMTTMDPLQTTTMHKIWQLQQVAEHLTKLYNPSASDGQQLLK